MPEALDRREDDGHVCDLGCPVTHAMSAPPIFGDPEMTIRAVARSMSEAGIGALVLIGPAGPSSIVTEHDLVAAVSLGADADAVWAADAGSSDLLTLQETDTLADAVRVMADEGVRHLPVRGPRGLVGVVSARDLLFVIASLLSPARS